MNTSVLQDWVVDLPLRMQSTLVLGIRGPDVHNYPEIKKVIRWLRGLTFKPGNPENVHEFMGAAEITSIKESSPIAKELEFCSQHFYSHIMHSLEVVGYRYPDPTICLLARDLFEDMAGLLHLPPEEYPDFEERLKVLKWVKTQPETYSEVKEK